MTFQTAWQPWAGAVLMGLPILGGCATVRSINSARHGLEKSVALWHDTIEPRVKHIEQIVGGAETTLHADVQRASELWQHDVEPRLARLEKVVSSIEAGVERDLRTGVIALHKRIEGYLLDLEHAGHGAEVDADKLRAEADHILVDARSVKVRLESDVEKAPLVKHVEALVGHVQQLARKHGVDVARSEIDATRTKVEGELSALLQSI